MVSVHMCSHTYNERHSTVIGHPAPASGVAHRPGKLVQRCHTLVNVYVVVSVTLCVFLYLLAGCCCITPESQLASLSLTTVSSGPACSYMLIVVLNGRGGFWLPHYSENMQLLSGGGWVGRLVGGRMRQNLRGTHPCFYLCHPLLSLPSFLTIPSQ